MGNLFNCCPFVDDRLRQLFKEELMTTHQLVLPTITIVIPNVCVLGVQAMNLCRNPTLAKCEDETHTPKVGDLESSETPKTFEFDNKGQNTSPWGVLGVIGKVLRCRCPKWPHMGHLDIYNPSYGQKKGRESNWQFDSRPLKVGNRPLPDIQI
jgi:hypothetical protein